MNWRLPLDVQGDECLRAGATPGEIMEVLRLATVMAECPGDRYRAIVQRAIDTFDQ
jgi:alkylhydroperoxidase/carboxymuconolactone decarboxylase family protein YurZ